VLAIVWAVYLIPKALKQHDEVARTRSVDRFSDETRVVARREPVSRRDARLVVPSPSAEVTVETSVAVSVEPAGSPGRRQDRRTPGRAVAVRRRRRILVALLLLVVSTAAAAYLGRAPWWSTAVPGGLALAFLLLCRKQAGRRRSRPHRIPAQRPAPAPYAAEPSTVTVTQHTSEPTSEHTSQPTSEPEAELAVQPVPEPAPVVEAQKATGTTLPPVDSGALWDPVPVTLPTYVTKPKARRTVRTIDLGEAGTWTSGRTPEDAEIAARATDPDAVESQSTKAGRRAVGT